MRTHGDLVPEATRPQTGRPSGFGSVTRRKTAGGTYDPRRGRCRREHIKDSLEQRGTPEGKAEEIAARTVNKERARHGESAEASRLSKEDISSGRRGGLRSHRRAPRGRTKDQLYEEARSMGVKGRSSMTKAELERAVSRSKS